jgi:hypothetical protein
MFCNSVCHLVGEDTANTNARGDFGRRTQCWWYVSACSLVVRIVVLAATRNEVKEI